jgi:hypothetical protein
MNAKTMDLLKSQIQYLQDLLNKLYTDYTVPYDEVLKLSQKLDILIVKYQKLQLESNKEDTLKAQYSLYCA